MKKHILCFVKEDDGSNDTTLYPTPSVIFVVNNVEATVAANETLLLAIPCFTRSFIGYSDIHS